ncbi:MAG: P-II family nitrogen regulator [Deltaproteobacteria bacterium]|nr:P-II family nitrogen regulator [Deltaproteobacteria bacterium]
MKTAPSKCDEDADSSQFKKVAAIVRIDVLKKVEQALQGLHVPGVSVTKVKGYGEYSNFFRSDWMVESARIEIFVRRERAKEIARAIIDAAHSGIPGDGLVVISSVEAVYRIRSKELATPDELG